MEYYSGERSHSSPGYSYSERSYHRELTPEEKEQQAQKEREEEQQQELEQKVKTSLIPPPTQVRELINQEIASEQEVWFYFLGNVSDRFSPQVAAIASHAVSDGYLSFSKLIARGIELEVAIELYRNWDKYWSKTLNKIAPTHELTNDSNVQGKQTDNKSLHTTQTVKDSTQEHQFDREPTYEVAFLPAIPVAIIGGFVLVAAGSTLLLQIEDENGELVTVNEYASRPIADLLKAISNDIKNYYQTDDEIATIKAWVAPALEKIVVTTEPENQVYTTPNGERRLDKHRGSVPPLVSTQTPGFDTEAGREVETQQHTGNEVSREVDWDNYIFESEEFDTRKIPGIHVPFRDYDPKHPPNWSLVEAAQNTDFKDPYYDCSEIAEDIQKAAGGKGRIIEVTPDEGKLLKLLESGKTTGEKFYYHQVYTDGRYVYDPRLDKDKPIPKGDWEKLMRGLNPGSDFKYLK